METNNKLREALVCLRDAARKFNHQILNSKYNGILDKYTCAKQGFSAALEVVGAIVKANYAIAAPARNCDVGTAEEQYERYCNFTGRYNPCSYEGNVRCADDCPIHKKLTQEGHGELLCQLEWAQMPYEESDTK